MRYSKKEDDAFIKVWKRLGSPTLVGKELGVNPRSAMTRRKNIEIRYNIELPTFNSQRLFFMILIDKILLRQGKMKLMELQGGNKPLMRFLLRLLIMFVN